MYLKKITLKNLIHDLKKAWKSLELYAEKIVGTLYLESGVAEHVVDTGHHIDWTVKVLDQDLNQRRRLVREAVCIKKVQPSMNRDQGYELSKAYNKLIEMDGRPADRPGGGDH